MSADQSYDDGQENRPDVQQFLKQLHARKARKDNRGGNPAPPNFAPQELSTVSPTPKPVARQAPPQQRLPSRVAPALESRHGPEVRREPQPRGPERMLDERAPQEPAYEQGSPDEHPHAGRIHADRAVRERDAPCGPTAPEASAQPASAKSHGNERISRNREMVDRLLAPDSGTSDTVQVETEKTKRLAFGLSALSMMLSLLVVVFAPVGREVISLGAATGFVVLAAVIFGYDRFFSTPRQ